MFAAIGTFVFRMRFAVIGVLIALMAGLGLYGMDLGKHLSQSGWFDPTSESDQGSRIADTAFGRDHKSDVILVITPPEGTKVDNPEFGAKVENFVDDLIAAHPDIVNRQDPGIVDPFRAVDNSPANKAAQETIRSRTFSEDKTHAFVSIGVKGDDDTTILKNYKTIEPFFHDIDNRFDLQGTKFELAGLQPVAGAMSDGMDKDIHRAEVIALPVVAIMLFFIFGGVVSACLPVLIGGLTIAGSLGIMKVLAQVTELNIFAQSVVTLIGLGIAIDYGLFIVSRFREELAEGYSTKAAVRRTVMTAGQTVVFSATIIVAALACLLIFPQGFLKSVAYGAISSVALAAILSITVLPAVLAILGKRIDALGLPFLRRTKTRKEIEEGFWGKLAGWVMRHPIKTAVPTVILLLLLILPFSGIKFGGISEEYLPPDNPNRVAQENFDQWFPSERTEEIKLVIAYDPNGDDAAKLDEIAAEANKIPGFTKQFSTSDDSVQTGNYGENGPAIFQMSAGLVDRNTAGEAIKELRAIDTQGLSMYVAGTPALTQDSIDALLSRLPIMATLLVLVTGFLMFLAFGSVVLPIKAALMSALGLASTLGILTWIFVDGHGASIANFTPGPLFAAVLVLIIAIVFGLSTDYEIFLLSRMVEARQKGASTTEAVRIGTAHTGRIITAAAAILVVVTGAFGLSEIVMMKYIAYGMIAALILDATVIRMLLVPAVMKLLGDDCWWAPRWLAVVQQKIGLGETVLDDEPDEQRDSAKRARSAGTLVAEAPTSKMTSARSRGEAGPDSRRRPQPDAQPAQADRRRPGPGAPTPGAGPRTVASPAARPAPPDRRPQPDRPQPGADRPTLAPQGRPADLGGAERTAPPSRRAARPPVPDAAPVARVGVSAPPSGPTPTRSAPPPTGQTLAPTATGSRPSPSLAARPSRESARANKPDTGGWSLGEGGIRLGGSDTSRPPANADRPVRPERADRSGDHPVLGSTNGSPRSSSVPVRPPSPARPSSPPSGANRVVNPAARPPDSPLRRRPALDETGKRPLAASLAPEAQGPAGRRRPAGTGANGSALDRGMSPSTARAVEGRNGDGAAGNGPHNAAPQNGAPSGSGGSGPEGGRPDRSSDSSSRSDRHARSDDEGSQISVQELLRRSRSES
ncbi:MMPL family transporter [Gordonia soli]|uniref:Membrane transport protein MMPL domain-containing protein n=1 Tax=Gordonia soli NBRC 108243 TaxID=1223545 RepID=M0QFX0_9ACTN|nr:MMPL family transporter [Gordonia soli]GAC67206.1 hypothetical protein GS4_06_00520 [Gordonia soli NBRC 108243]